MDFTLGLSIDPNIDKQRQKLPSLLEEVMPRAPNLKGVTFEFHDSYFPRFGADGVRKELARARDIWSRHRPR